MPSRTASTGRIERLIADLGSTDAVHSDAAVARLRVLGARALPRLSAFIASAPPSRARALAISALEGVTDPHAADVALACLDGDIGSAVAALGVLRTWVTEEAGTRILEAVTAVALDTARDARVRLAAVDALADLPDHLVRPVRDQAPPPESAGPIVDDPVRAREWVEAHGADTHRGERWVSLTNAQPILRRNSGAASCGESTHKD